MIIDYMYQHAPWFVNIGYIMLALTIRSIAKENQ